MMLMDLESGAWDDELLGIFDVPRAVLPQIVPSSGRVGMMGGIPISGIAGDQQAALAGQACFRAGLSKNTYGTGCLRSRRRARTQQTMRGTGGASGMRERSTRAAAASAISQYQFRPQA